MQYIQFRFEVAKKYCQKAGGRSTAEHNMGWYYAIHTLRCILKSKVSQKMGSEGNAISSDNLTRVEKYRRDGHLWKRKQNLWVKENIQLNVYKKKTKPPS